MHPAQTHVPVPTSTLRSPGRPSAPPTNQCLRVHLTSIVPATVRLCASAPYLVYRNTNPRQVYVGKAPWLWPVNGFLAGPSQNQSSTMYIGLYQQGYKTGHEVCNYTSSGTRRVGAR